MGIYPNGIGVRIEADGPGAVNPAQQSGEGWWGKGWELPQMVRGEYFPQLSFNLTTIFEDGDHDWDKVSPES